jgi:hypothetical protein
MVPPNPVKVGPVRIGKDCPLALIAGPCVMEPGDMTMRIARHLAELCGGLGIPLVFKASFDKANRTSGSSFRGPGLAEGMRIFAQVKAETGLPVTTDVHETIQARRSPRWWTCQVPAFLARQTDLLEAVAGTGRPINTRKGSSWPRGMATLWPLIAPGLGRASDRARDDVRLWPARQRFPRDPADAVDRGTGGLRPHSVQLGRRCRGHCLFGARI